MFLSSATADSELGLMELFKEETHLDVVTVAMRVIKNDIGDHLRGLIDFLLENDPPLILQHALLVIQLLKIADLFDDERLNRLRTVVGESHSYAAHAIMVQCGVSDRQLLNMIGSDDGNTVVTALAIMERHSTDETLMYDALIELLRENADAFIIRKVGRVLLKMNRNQAQLIELLLEKVQLLPVSEESYGLQLFLISTIVKLDPSQTDRLISCMPERATVEEIQETFSEINVTTLVGDSRALLVLQGSDHLVDDVNISLRRDLLFEEIYRGGDCR